LDAIETAGGSTEKSETHVGDKLDVAEQNAEPQPRRSAIERAVLVPVGAVLLAAEELLGLATALTDAEKAGRELLHFEERGVRARAHVEGLVHHHRSQLADRLELHIEQTRDKLGGLASKGNEVASKIRPHVPTHS
jgi:predicted component of type VI protein secretion system